MKQSVRKIRRPRKTKAKKFQRRQRHADSEMLLWLELRASGWRWAQINRFFGIYDSWAIIKRQMETRGLAAPPELRSAAFLVR